MLPAYVIQLICTSSTQYKKTHFIFRLLKKLLYCLNRTLKKHYTENQNISYYKSMPHGTFSTDLQLKCLIAEKEKNSTSIRIYDILILWNTYK